MKANEGKSLEVELEGHRFQRIPIHTSLVLADDKIDRIVSEFAAPVVKSGDWLFVTEKIVAITQGRSYPVESITPRRLAFRLSKHVKKTPSGIGLGMPETMEMALRECGVLRILFAAAVAAITKKLGRKGDFYRIAGPKARGIDGPTSGTIPPFNKQVVLAPENPKKVATEIKGILPGGVEVLVVDINDFGGNVLGSTLGKAQEGLAARILADNPLGQGHQSTPMGIIRKL